ncbi:hypothetical protein MUG84_12005 [Paenibacillus sp. KQZ6P-2]|uniref:Uncharacterized protein n=1 Tax=Paenibacillus mangrovi TaxID=2931978 RepID=A0A9X1WNE4_9BACL|nr:hypothetical protein [Paenibacillus mangrovi]MCJ8012457.1 hypothetical protein [Paenibacillus mangrovi]
MIVKNSRWLAGLLILAASLLVGFQSPAQGVKATWVWQTELIEDGGGHLLDFARQEGINLIYLQINRDLPKATYETFIQNAHKEAIAVHALGGDPGWALQEHQDRMLGLADWTMNYNASVSPENQFDGIHLDIEPYVLPQWNTNKQAVISSWESNLKAFLAKTSGSSLELGIDIPFWFDDTKTSEGGSLNEWLMNSFDHVTVLAYRNEVDTEHGIVYLSKDELALADRLGKQVLVAVNTKEMPGEAHTSFYGRGKDQMNQSLRQLSGELSSHASFAGIAIHDFRNWENMPGGGGGGGTDPGGEQPGTDPNPPINPDPTPDPDPGAGDRVPDADPVNRDQIVRGTYIWDANEVLQNGQEILDFAKEKNLNWLYVRLDLQQPFSAYSSFVKQASAAGIEVHAMGGHPIWALQENRPKMMKLVKYVKDYNRAVQGDERFHGIHLDIEPYVLPEWRSDPQGVIAQWTSNLDAFVTELKKDSNLQASMDLAVWLDKYKAPGEDISLSKWMINRMDHVSLMAFRDKAGGSNGIVNVSKEEIAFANELGKPILLSVEMKESREGNHITFYEEGAQYMEGELAKLPDLLKSSPSYTGNVVHAYSYWKNAKP